MSLENSGKLNIRPIPKLGADQLVYVPKDNLDDPNEPDMISFLTIKSEGIEGICRVTIPMEPLSLTLRLKIYAVLEPIIYAIIDDSLN